MESRVLKIERKALQAWSQIDVGSGAWWVTFSLRDVG